MTNGSVTREKISVINGKGGKCLAHLMTIVIGRLKTAASGHDEHDS